MSGNREEPVRVGTGNIQFVACFSRRIQCCSDGKPGQFLSLYSDDGSRLLPRPISICEIDAAKRMIRLVYRVAGAGTLEFSGKQEGDTIAVVGPLGNGFTPRSGKSILIGRRNWHPANVSISEEPVR